MSVTLQQVAEMAGVTPGTVSRVLNGRYKENRPAIAKRADKIRQVARSMGYRPNLAARSVSRGRFGQTAFVTCGDLGFDWFAPQMLHGIHEGLDEINSRLVVNEMSAEALSDPSHLPRLFRESAVDGMLINIDAKLPESIVEMFDQQPIPVVLMNVKRRSRCVYPDERAGGQLAVQHLLDKGCKKPAFFMLVHPDRSPHYSRTERVAGFDTRLHESGLSSQRRMVGHPDYVGAQGNGVKIAADFLKTYSDLDGVVCYGLTEATALFAAAAAMGRVIPKDLPVIVFNDQVAHAMTGIPMDTILVPFKEVGLRAVHMIHKMTDEHGPRRPVAEVVDFQQIYIAQSNEMLEVKNTSDQSAYGVTL